MKDPSLQKTAALSAVLHVTFFLLTTLVLKQTSQMPLSSPYIVSLVGPVNGPRERTAESTAPLTQQDTRTVPEEKNTTRMTIMKKDEKIDQKRIEDKIAEIESEIASKKKIERLASLKKKMVSIGGVRNEKLVTRMPPQGSAGAARSSQGTGGTAEPEYLNRIKGEIEQAWFWPSDWGNKRLQAIVAVTVRKDGTLKVEDWGKKSGNVFFDKSVLKAIEKASPVFPPPKELSIDLNFEPKPN